MIVNLLPLVGRAIGAIALARQGMCRRTEPKNIEQQTFVITLVAMRNESVLGPPAMRESRPAVARPIPVGAAVKRIGQVSDLGLVGRVAIKIGAGRQCAREQKSRIEGGKLALPDAAAGFDVQEVIEETLVPAGVGLGTLRAFKKVAQAF